MKRYEEIETTLKNTLDWQKTAEDVRRNVQNEREGY